MDLKEQLVISMFSKTFKDRYDFIFIFILIVQCFCKAGFANDLRDLLLSGDFIRSQKLLPSPLDFTLREVTGDRLKIAHIFSLKNKLNDLSNLSKAELEELLEYRELITRQLLLDVNESGLSSFRGLLRAKVDATTFDENKAYTAAAIVKSIYTLSSPWPAPKEVIRDAAWSLARSASWGGAIGGSATAAAREAAWNVAGGAPRGATQEELKKILPTLGEVDPHLLRQKVYGLSELLTLNWMINNLFCYERAFHAAYDRLDGLIAIAQAKESIERHINTQEFAANPFIIEYLYFLNESETEINKASRASRI